MEMLETLTDRRLLTWYSERVASLQAAAPSGAMQCCDPLFSTPAIGTGGI